MDEYSAEFDIADHARELRLKAILQNATGSLSVSNLEVRPLSNSTYYEFVRIALVLAWAALAIAVMYFSDRLCTSRASRLLLLLVFLVLITGMLLAEPEKLFSVLTSDSETQESLNNLEWLFHFLVFSALAFLVRLDRKNHSRLTVDFFGLVALSTITEIIQPLFHRSAEFHDWLANGAGIVFGFALATGLLMLKRKSLGR